MLHTLLQCPTSGKFDLRSFSDYSQGYGRLKARVLLLSDRGFLIPTRINKAKNLYELSPSGRLLLERFSDLQLTEIPIGR